jgi:hypothetical protein
MDPIRVDLVALRRPVEYQFPNERWFRIAPFRGPGKALLAAWQREPQNGQLLIELLRMAVPTATDEDFDTLSVDEDIPRVIAAADGKAALVEAALKNGPSGGVFQMPSPTLPSSPTTSPPTSSAALPASPKPTGARGKKSTSKSGTSPSLRSTG